MKVEYNKLNVHNKYYYSIVKQKNRVKVILF